MCHRQNAASYNNGIGGPEHHACSHGMPPSQPVMAVLDFEDYLF